METETISELKDAFHDWMGTLSIEEIASNDDLIQQVNRVNRLLNEMGN